MKANNTMIATTTTHMAEFDWVGWGWGGVNDIVRIFRKINIKTAIDTCRKPSFNSVYFQHLHDDQQAFAK